MRPRLILAAALLFAVTSGLVLVSSAMAGNDLRPTGQAGWREPTEAPPDPAAVPPPEPAVVEPSDPRRPDLSAEVSVEIDGFLTWAVLDRATGRMAHAGDQPNTTESMIKVWLAADFLRRHAERDTEPDDQALDWVRGAIRDSDSAAAEALYQEGGRDEVVERMIDMCSLTDTEIYPDWWSRTEITAIDAVRLGECVINGTAAGPGWTDWLLEEMRQVRGSTSEDDQRPEEGFEGGKWGIADGLPPGLYDQPVAIKNGWTQLGETNSWHVNCLAVTDEWVLAVLMRYPASRSLQYGADRCADVSAQLFPPLEFPEMR